MDAFVEVLHEDLRSFSPSYLEPLPNSAKLSSNLKSLEQTISQILPALTVAMRQADKDKKAEKLMHDVTKLTYQLETSLKKLESEGQLACDRLRTRRFSSKLMTCFDPSLLTCFCLQKRLSYLKDEFHRMVPKALPFSASDRQTDHDQATIYGREEDLQNLMLRLGSDEQCIAVLCIVGSPGIGKKTLARQVYDEEQLKSKFAVRAWVRVSENFDARSVCQDLLKELGNEKPYDLPSPQQQLQERLSGKRVLLVLDHVGEIDPAAWARFMDPLGSAAPGSRVLMTTMTDANTLSMGSLPSYELERYELKRLTDEACWSLLASVAFPDKNPDEYSHLVAIGKKMVEKCEGHPHKTKVLGRILRDKMNKSDWESVLAIGPWESGGDKSSQDSLFMSYDGLSARMRRCFAYCSIFPKDYKIVKETLMQCWMAEDLVQVPREHRGTSTLESIAERYFDNLKANDFFRDSSEDEGISMRELVSNLALVASGKECYHLKNNQDSSGPRDGDNPHSSTAPDPRETIRLSCIYDASMKLEKLSQYTNLRTLLFVCSPAWSRAISSDQMLPHGLFKNFPDLRVLSLSGLPLENLPDSIDNLSELRFLDLSHTLIGKLPQSITTLSNLLTLKLNNCVYLAAFPSMEKLIKLRHLDISGSNNIKAMPPRIGRLTDLRWLSSFIVSGVNESSIQELKDLGHLSGKLSIAGLQNVVNSDDAKEANLSNKTLIRELILEWSTKFGELRNKDEETQVLDYLKASSNLEILYIIGYGGTRFPEWISLCDKLVHVTLSNCRNSKDLPLLGQLPRLKKLSIERMEEVISIGAEFCGDVSKGKPFPSLETLEFKDMPKWEEFKECEGLPCLRLLKIERCPKLKEFKVVMEDLEMLTINECQELTAFSLQNLPNLRELDIQHCLKLKEMPQLFTSLTKLRIWGCQELTSLSKVQPNGEDIREEFPHLLTLDIQNCRSLKELPSKFPSLEKLRIKSCKELFKLSVFPNLHDLILEECDELMLENEVEESSLVSMAISQLPKLVYPRAQLLQCLSKLINLEISKCVNLEALTENGSQALSSLERLVIDGCPKLKQLPDLFTCFLSLKELIIVGCETLEFFPEMTLPPAFKRLVIQKCKLLKSLPPKLFDSPDISLEFLEVYGCPSLESLSQSKLPQTLRLLSVWNCSNLKFLPAGLDQENTSLTSIQIWDCQSLQDFPHEGLPCNIRSLSVINCGNIKSPSEWCLSELEYLSNFSFGGVPEITDFTDVRLPDSVSFLLLKGLPELVSLQGLLENLNSLDTLTIRDCPKLEILTEKKLPGSVSCVYISNCPMLRKRCRTEEEWYKIAHVPLIELDFQAMHKGSVISDSGI